MNHAPPTRKADVEALPDKLRSSTAWKRWLRLFPPTLDSGGYNLPFNQPTAKPNYDSTTIRYRRPVSYRSRTR